MKNRKILFMVTVWFLLLIYRPCFADIDDVLKQIVPKMTGLGYTHLQYNPSKVPGHTHLGVDIMAPCGSLIYPFADGIVTKIFNNTNGLGYAIMIRHPGLGSLGKDLYTIYLHMQSEPNINGKILSTGDNVFIDKPIGEIGESGFASGCHTHYEIRNFYHENAPGGGWYHKDSKNCDGTQNIYACGDLSDVDWAINDWENPQTFKVSGVCT